jgi:hypothetical protein
MGGHSKGAHRETMRDGQAQDKRFRPLWHTITVCEVCGAKPGLIGKKDPRIGPDGARWQPSMYGTIPSFHLQRCGHCLDAKQTEVPSAGVRPTKKWQLEVHDDGDVWLSAEKMQIEHVRESQFAKRPHDINTLWRAAVFSIMSLKKPTSCFCTPSSFGRSAVPSMLCPCAEARAAAVLAAAE